MAVLLKSGGRKPVVIGSLNVGYANFKELGLDENKHLKISIGDFESDYKRHTLSMTFKEAENLLTYLGYYLVGHSERTIDDLASSINANLEADNEKFVFQKREK